MVDAPSGLFAWTAAAAPEPIVAAGALASWNVDVARTTGGAFVLDDLSGVLLWTGTRKSADTKQLVEQGARVGRIVYPDVPTACQQRLYDIGRLTRTRRIADLFLRPVRLGGVIAPTVDARALLLHTFMARLTPLNRECVAVAADSAPYADELSALGFVRAREVEAYESRPRLVVWRRANSVALR